MAPPKRRRKTYACTPAASPIAWTIPVDLMLEIVARSDFSTIVRCAAACMLLRGEILTPSFIRRVTGQEGPDDAVVPPCLLVYLHTDDNDYLRTFLHIDDDKGALQPRTGPLSLVHPDTIAAVSFSDEHLAPFISRSATDLLNQYVPVMSRGGLIVLLRPNIDWWSRRSKSERHSDLCVYDIMTGERTFFSLPPDIIILGNNPFTLNYGLLTAADCIGCSFLLVVADVSYVTLPDSSCVMQVQSVSSDAGGIWGPVTFIETLSSPWTWLQPGRDAVVLRGGIIHWLARRGDYILIYDVGAETPGSVRLPVTNYEVNQLHMLPSSDGELLRLLVADGSMISMWTQRSASVGGGWELEDVIDVEEELWSLGLVIPPGQVLIEFENSGERSGVVLLRIGNRGRWFAPLIVLDLETKKMCRQRSASFLLEVDLTARLHAMKIFS